MWYNNTQHFGQRARQEHLDMDVNQFRRRLTDDGRKCIEFYEGPTKCRGGGLKHVDRVTTPKMIETGCDRCPVALFELYMSKRPMILKDSGRFYLTPKNNCSLDEPVCYIAMGVGKNKVSAFMKEIIKDTELKTSGLKFANHSGRKTAIRKLKKAKIPEDTIIKLTGHTTARGLRSYDQGDDGEFTDMSHTITAPTGPPASTRPLQPIDFQVTALPQPSAMTTVNNSFVQHNLSSVEMATGASGAESKGVSGNIFYINCKVYNIQNQNNGKKKRKYVIEDSSEESQ